MELAYELARPTEEDARLVMEWRNDSDTRKYSFHGDEKLWPAFYKDFLGNYFLFTDLPPLFVVANGKRVAFLNFKPCQDPLEAKRKCCEISLNVSREFRGKGIGGQALVEMQKWIKRQGYDDLYAEVKDENTFSHKAFLKAGFSKVSSAEKIIFETGEKALISRYVVQLTEMHKNESVVIVAEAGSNWSIGGAKQNIAMAKTLIEIAKESGADVVKFQVFRPESLYVSNAGSSSYLKSSGIEAKMNELFEDLAMPYTMIEDLFHYSQDVGIEFMATPFSQADFLAVDRFVSRHKIASYELGHIHLLKLAAKSLKPLYLSTGAATENEIAWAVKTFYEFGGKDLTLLQCTAAYPAPAKAMNLQAIPWLKARFKGPVGLSDHSIDPINAPVAAVALGASVIEKHFTLDRRLPGPDHAFALMPKELIKMVLAIRQASAMQGAPIKIIADEENELRNFARRGLQAIKEIFPGDIFKENDNVAILRPGGQTLGIHPQFLSTIEGKKATRYIPIGSGIMHGDYLL